jgi:hypothetical protein
MRVALGLLVAAAMLGTPALADGGSATVLRGNAPAESGGVAVLRGPGSGPLPPLRQAEPQRRIIAGGRAWIVDEERGTLTGCRMERTSRVGVRRVVCASRRLPGS